MLSFCSEKKRPPKAYLYSTLSKIGLLHNIFLYNLASAISSYLRKSPVLLDEGNDNGLLNGAQAETLFTFYLEPDKLVT